jgi:hypothetical protein
MNRGYHRRDPVERDVVSRVIEADIRNHFHA